MQVLSVTDGDASSSVAHAEGWPGVLEGLLGAYKRLGVADCVPLAVEITELMDAVAVARVHWALQREDREPVYDFTAVYTLARIQGRFSDRGDRARRAREDAGRRTNALTWLRLSAGGWGGPRSGRLRRLPAAERPGRRCARAARASSTDEVW